MKIIFDKKKNFYNILKKKKYTTLQTLRIKFKGINWFRFNKILTVSNINYKDELKYLNQYKNILISLLRFKYILFIPEVYKIPSKNLYFWTKYILNKNKYEI